jgi:hypothetical protein
MMFFLVTGNRGWSSPLAPHVIVSSRETGWLRYIRKISISAESAVGCGRHCRLLSNVATRPSILPESVVASRRASRAPRAPHSHYRRR